MPALVVRVMRAVPAMMLMVGLVACGASGDPADDAPPAVQAAMSARTVYPAKREEWRSDITTHTDSTMVPHVFRASRTTVALLQTSPSRISQFELHGHGLLLSARPARVDPVLHAEVPRDIVAPTDLSRVTDEGQLDIMDSASSTLVRESIGGYVFRRQLPLLRGGTGRLCTMAPATLLHLRVLGSRRALEAFMLTGNADEDTLVGRHRLTVAQGARLRFGTGDVRRCLLITEREVMVVSAPAEGSTIAAPRITALRPPGGARPGVAGDSASPFAVAPDSATLMQPFVVDAAVVDGGFAVLVGVISDRQGRVIDYYDERGEYLQSAMLPFTASAMTGSGPRFLLLHQDEKHRWWLSSWLTPMAARGATPPPDPPRINRAPHRQLFEPPP